MSKNAFCPKLVTSGLGTKNIVSAVTTLHKPYSRVHSIETETRSNIVKPL